MRPAYIGAMIGAALVVCVSSNVSAQLRRSPAPGAGSPSAAPAGVPRDRAFPYAGVWRGLRTLPPGTDSLGMRLTVVDGKYVGVLLHPGGHTSPENHLTATAAGLTFDHPNSGGGTWTYHVRLAGPDSMVGTIVLRDAPPNLTPAPEGTMVFLRVAADGPSRER